MMYRTHLLFGIFLALAFLDYANNKLIFFLVILASTFLPDVDCMHSYLGREKIFRPLQWFVKHRGFFHSLLFCIAIAVIFSFYYPPLALPFFLGYAGHLLLDSFTDNGIRPFWPFKKELKGFVRTNGNVEKGIFYFLILANLIIFISIVL
ncbi:MAG: metal-dependent hydrolase [Nanoarchaeota archaeon]|nr:metal-dependent hydrolase [Nanoarchaeota archaeon]